MAGSDTYLLNLRGVDWSQALAPWAPLLPPRVSLLMANRFGDVFLTLDDQSIRLLNLAAGTFEKAADSLRDLTDLLELDVLRETLLMTKLADACIEAGLDLRPGQVYGYKIPPFLGGASELANIRVTDALTHYRVMAQVLRRARHAG